MVEIDDKQPILPEKDSFLAIYWLLIAFLIFQILIYYLISIQLK
jgi:hypothetical protein